MKITELCGEAYYYAIEQTIENTNLKQIGYTIKDNCMDVEIMLDNAGVEFDWNGNRLDGKY